MKELYLCGAGNPEGVRLALTINRKQARWDRIVLLDDDPAKHERSILGIDIAGPFDLLEGADSASEVCNLIARTTVGRQLARLRIETYGLPFATLISPDIDTIGVELPGADLTVYQKATLGPEVSIEECSVVFIGAVVGHGSHVGRGCVVAPNAVINARVRLGDGVYVGTNASILPEVNVGPWATIGAGSVVVRDVPAGASVLGVPGEILLPDDQENAGGHRGPRTSVEGILARIWCEVTGEKRIGIHDSFLRVGGTLSSLERMSSGIEQTFGVEVSLGTLLENPTIAALAETVEDRTIEQADDTRFEGALRDIERMSDEEASALVHGMPSSREAASQTPRLSGTESGTDGNHDQSSLRPRSSSPFTGSRRSRST